MFRNRAGCPTPQQLDWSVRLVRSHIATMFARTIRVRQFASHAFLIQTTNLHPYFRVRPLLWHARLVASHARFARRTNALHLSRPIRRCRRECARNFGRRRCAVARSRPRPRPACGSKDESETKTTVRGRGRGTVTTDAARRSVCVGARERDDDDASTPRDVRPSCIHRGAFRGWRQGSKGVS